MAGSALQVRVAFVSLACSAFRAFVAIFTATNLSRLHRANRTGDPGVLAHLRHDKTADLPLLQGAELAPGCHLLPGSRWGGRWSTIQLAEGGNPFLPPNSGHLPPSRRWRWRLVVMKHSQGFSRSFSFFYRNFLLRLLSSWGKFFLQKLFSPSCISSQC